MANSKPTERRTKQTGADGVYANAIPAYPDQITDNNTLALVVVPAVARVKVYLRSSMAQLQLFFVAVDHQSNADMSTKNLGIQS